MVPLNIYDCQKTTWLLSMVLAIGAGVIDFAKVDACPVACTTSKSKRGVKTLRIFEKRTENYKYI